jgi:hypothetical protein
MRNALLVLGLTGLLASFGCSNEPPATQAPDSGSASQPDSGPGDAGVPGCADECASGTQSCDGTSAYRICGHYDEDGCLELSPAIACGQGERCVTDRCVATCRDECDVGSTICGDAVTVLVCGNFDDDACREPGGPTRCEDGERCEAGRCVPDGSACTDECASVGQRVCSGDAVRTCGLLDADSCLDLGTPIACGAGERCENGDCVVLCEDECSAGAVECSGDGYRSCGQHDADSCLDWSPVTACPPGETCGNGICAATCQDECPQDGATVCTSDHRGYQQCGQLDSDPCLDRSTAVPCSTGYACQDGACVATCSDECSLGSRRCGSDGTSVETCGNYDDDPCREWGGAVACAGSAPCADGACLTPCTDECSPAGALACANGQEAVQSCGEHDQDSCLDWSSPSACQSWEVCREGACVLGATPPAILINEIVFDSAGTDADSGNNLFVELWGTPGQSLDGFSLVGINGANGADYNAIDLTGSVVGADGYFLVAHPNGAASLTSVAEVLRAAVDYQNGPDSVQLRWRGQVMDALGYGSFGSAQTFAGEGRPAPIASNGSSLSRNPAHADTDDNAADFSVSAASPRAAGAACSDECSSELATRCSGSLVETCVRGADGCLDWSAPAACPSGQACAGGSCQASGADAGASDAGSDAGTGDAGSPDGGYSDGGHSDGGYSDGGYSDGGLFDGGSSDAGSGTDIWMEIDYSSAYTPRSPRWSYSATPGWGEAQWAMPGDSWPEAWDRYNNMSVVDDQAGSALLIGTSSELQLMFGLEELRSYESMTVRLEGHAYGSSMLRFDVLNPLNGCGTSGTMSSGWDSEVVELDLGSCAVVGAGVQAVRVDTTSGEMALVRMRVTIHGAVW